MAVSPVVEKRLPARAGEREGLIQRQREEAARALANQARRCCRGRILKA